MNIFFKNKTFLSIFVTFFLFVQIFGVFFARPVYAQLIVADTTLDTLGISKKVSDNAEKALLSAALGALVNGASIFMRRIAYDAAKYIAAGGKGQGALAFNQSPGDYFKSVGGDVAAGAIDSFGSSVGLNLCQPSNLTVLKNLQTGLSDVYRAANSLKTAGASATKYIGSTVSGVGGSISGSGSAVYGSGSAAVNGGQAKCTWSNFVDNWSNVPDMFGKDTLSQRFASSLDSSQSDFGIALSSIGKLNQLVSDQKASATVSRLEGAGFKPVTGLISGNIKTSAKTVGEESKSATAKSLSEQSSSQIAGLYGSQTIAILPTALSIFASTLVSSLLTSIFTKGTIPESGGDPLNFAASTLVSNRQIADNVFSFLIAGIPQRSLSSYDIVNYYSSCPDNPGLDNCIMDGSLADALTRSDTDHPMTIREAMDSKVNLLHGDWVLIPPIDLVNNTDPRCYTKAYCYSNIQKMRKARILPLGFEIAALKSNPDNPVTLQQVVDGYNDCNDSLTPDLAFPFCHLIDPNWIFKVPEVICEDNVIGPQLVYEGTNQRATQCVDFSTCLAYGDNGKCKSFGYCTQEKNVWNIPGQSCPAEDVTCKTYTSTSGKIASYLSRTLDYGTCNAGSVGCQAYSTNQVNGKWQVDNQISLADQSDGKQQVLYFNNKIDNYTCPAGVVGCSLFIYPSTNQSAYLKKAPDYLDCYDTNTSTIEINWPQTKADLTKLSEAVPDAQKCSNFAQVCIPEEVGCDEYTPKDGGTVLTGVVGNNSCPAECVGYETFKQDKTDFEPEKFPLYFVPTGSNVQSCAPQYAGCDEFTNLGANGGEQLEYYSSLKYCQSPDSDNAKTYYSWEGSDTQGYVLKKHSLLQIDSVAHDYLVGLSLVDPVATTDLSLIGSPAYVADDKTTLENNFISCNPTNYDILVHNTFRPEAADADCRALYDDTGNVYYRLLSQTVTVSAQCQPLRKTEANFNNDSSLTDSSACTAKGGKWDGSNPGGSCLRCTNGGTYEAVGDYCKYWTIPSEAESCPAVVNGCRLYIGNTGNNIQNIYTTSFEPNDGSADALKVAKLNWGNIAIENDTNVTVEPEATKVGSYSLKVHSGSTQLHINDKLKSGSWYELSFWARGDNSQVLVYFGDTPTASSELGRLGNFTVDPLTGNNVPAIIGFDWKEYKLGPVLYNGATSTNIISFSGTSGASYFIDNVNLFSMGDNPSDYVPIIKDSWKTTEGYDVSQACDSTPLDPYPGEYLGCKSYVPRSGGEINLIGFQNLCRAEAVGCVGLVDTNNVRPEAFNSSDFISLGVAPLMTLDKSLLFTMLYVFWVNLLDTLP